MEQQNYQYQKDSVFVQEKSVSKKFFANVFLWMFVALALSTAAAFFITSTPSVLAYFINQSPQTGRLGLSGLGFAAVLAPLGLVFLLGRTAHRMSFGAMLGVFLLYSVLTGVFLSIILMTYTLTSVAICFAAATVIFGIMAVMGYTTNVDLSQFRSILFAGVIGIVVISLINVFIGSETLNYILGIVGVAVFTALTAYKVQEIKHIGQGLDENGSQISQADSNKLALFGALSLYITFINLFVSLLRIFGNRR
jgi:FtsH-binding integral membrane protein